MEKKKVSRETLNKKTEESIMNCITAIESTCFQIQHVAETWGESKAKEAVIDDMNKQISEWEKKILKLACKGVK